MSIIEAILEFFANLFSKEEQEKPPVKVKNKEIIKKHEGLRLEAYRDPVGVWTIGWGHTHTAKPGMKISLDEAINLLARDIAWAENAVKQNVTIKLNQNQFDALVSFVFNVGERAFMRSSLLRRLNEGNYTDAANELLRWKHAGGRVLPGLVKRRAAERELFLS